MQAIVNKSTGECLEVTNGEFKLTGLPPGCAPPVVPPGFENVTLDGEQAEWGWVYDPQKNALVADAEVRAAIEMTSVDAKADGLLAIIVDAQAQLDALKLQADASTVAAIQAEIDAAKAGVDDVKDQAAAELEAVSDVAEVVVEAKPPAKEK